MRGERGNIVILDDQKYMIELLMDSIVAHNIFPASSLSESSQKLRKEDIDLAIVDLDFGGSRGIMAGIDYIKTIRNRYPHLAIMVLSNHAETPTVVLAILQGADDFQAKESVLIDSAEFRDKVNDLVELKRKREKINQKFQITEWGNSPDSKKIKERLNAIAEDKNSFFLIAEPGSNSERFVRYLYLKGYDIDELKEPVTIDLSLLRKKDILNVLKGKFQNRELDFLKKANKSILFIRSIESCNREVQRGFVSVIEKGSYLQSERNLDIQFVFGLKNDPRKLSGDLRLDEDLIYKTTQLIIPPLRSRTEDIDPLIDQWLHSQGLKVESLPIALRERFRSYAFPGNEGELINILERMLDNHKAQFKDSFKKSPIGWQSVPSEILERGEDLRNLKFDIARLELGYIDNALRLKNGIIKEAAEALSASFDKSWNKDNLRYRIKKYNKDYPDLLRQYSKIVECYPWIETK